MGTELVHYVQVAWATETAAGMVEYQAMDLRCTEPSDTGPSTWRVIYREGRKFDDFDFQFGEGQKKQPVELLIANALTLRVEKILKFELDLILIKDPD